MQQEENHSARELRPQPVDCELSECGDSLQPSDNETNPSRWEMSCHVLCLTCQTDNVIDEAATKFTCVECGQDQAVASPCCMEHACRLNDLLFSCAQQKGSYRFAKQRW